MIAIQYALEHGLAVQELCLEAYLDIAIDDDQLLLIKFEDFNRHQEDWVRRAARHIGATDDFPFERTRRPNAWGYKHRLEKDQFEELLPYYKADIAEVERLTGWDCGDWRRFEKSTGTAAEEAARAVAGPENPTG